MAGPVGDGAPRVVDPAVVEVQGLRMRYRDHDVLQGVDLQVGRREVVVLLGPNGAGKTTTVEILEGFRRPSAVVVRVLVRTRCTPTRRGAPGWGGVAVVAGPCAVDAAGSDGALALEHEDGTLLRSRVAPYGLQG